MSAINKVAPMGYAMARELSHEELKEVGGGLTGSVTGHGGGDPGPIRVSPDVDGDISF